MKITDALLGEHGVFYAQFDLFEETVANGTLDAIKKQGALLAAGLVPHAHIENEILFPALDAVRKLGEGGPTTPFRLEHQEIEGGLERLQQIRETRSVEEARELAGEVLHTVRGHFAREENMLLPLAEQILERDTLEDLGRQWAERRKVVLG